MLRHFQNKEGVIYDENNHKTLYAEDLNNLNGELQTMHSRLNDIPPRAEANQIIEGVDAIAYVNPLALKESENAHLKDINTPITDILEGLGSEIKSISFGFGHPTTTALMTNRQLNLNAIHNKKRQVIKGVGYIMTTSGSYTADNTNAIGLYSVNNGILSLINRTANNVNLWNRPTNIVNKELFESEIILERGTYFIGILLNASSVSVAPVTACHPSLGPNVNSDYDLPYTYKVACHIGTQLTMPVTIDATTLFRNATHRWLFLF